MVDCATVRHELRPRWVNVWHADHRTGGDGELVVHIEESLTVNVEALRQSLADATVRENTAGEVKMEFLGLVSEGASASISTEMCTRLEESVRESKNAQHRRSCQLNVRVRSGEALAIYQLHLEGGGVHMGLNRFETRPLHEMPEEPLVYLDFNVLNRLYLRDVAVRLQDHELPIGGDELGAGCGRDVNRGFGGKFVYLVPEWTADPSQAVSEIKVVFSKDPMPGMVDLAAGAGGLYRYLYMIRPSTPQPRITWIDLKRSGQGDLPAGHDWVSEDLNKERGGDFLWLVASRTARPLGQPRHA